MIDPDLLAALLPVLDTLHRLGVPHHVGGSIASSAHGIARASIDADVVAGLQASHVAPLVAARWARPTASRKSACATPSSGSGPAT